MKDMILLAESLESIVRLSDEDAGSLVKALATGDTENLSEIASIIFPLIKGQVERMADMREKRSAAGRIGGSKTKQIRSKSEANVKQIEAPVPVPEPVPNLNQNKVGRFVPPTVDEVRAYAQEKGLKINADRFVDFYSSKGWMVGKSKMKDWRAAVRSWAARDRQEAPETKKTDYRTMMIAHAYGEAST